MRFLTRCIIALLACAGGAHAADAVPPELAQTYDRVTTEAEKRLESEGPEAAIKVYEEALFNQPYGRFHLRLGQLYRDLERYAEAAVHFRACAADERVDPIDREIICEEGLAEVTAPLTLSGLPEGGRVVLVAPRDFAGPFTSGDRVPRGKVTLTVEAPGHLPRQSDVQVDGPTAWQVVVGLRRPQGPLVPSAFIADEGDAPLDQPAGFGADDTFVHDLPPEEEEGGGLRWPAYTAGGVGLAMVATGLTIGFVNQAELDDIRDRQRSGECAAFCKDDLVAAENLALTADVLWIGGTVVAASSVVLWFLFDE